MIHLFDHIGTNEAQIDLVVKARDKSNFPCIWETAVIGDILSKVKLVADSRFEPKIPEYFRKNTPEKSQKGCIPLRTGDHIFALIATTKSKVKYEVFKVINISTTTIKDNDHESAGFIVTVIPKRYSEKMIFTDDGTYSQMEREFIKRGLRLAVDNDVPTYWSSPWDTYNNPHGTSIAADITATNTTKGYHYKTSEQVFLKLKEIASEAARIPVVVRYTINGANNLKIEYQPIATKLTDINAGHPLEYQDVILEMNGNDASSYIIDPLTTFHKRSKEELIDFLSNKKIKSDNGTYSVIRVFKL
jgi:hypothetical protein